MSQDRCTVKMPFFDNKFCTGDVTCCCHQFIVNNFEIRTITYLLLRLSWKILGLQKSIYKVDSCGAWDYYYWFLSMAHLSNLVSLALLFEVYLKTKFKSFTVVQKKKKRVLSRNCINFKFLCVTKFFNTRITKKKTWRVASGDWLRIIKLPCIHELIRCFMDF